MRDIFKKLKSDDRGAAMAVALLVVLVLSLLGAALWQYFMVDTDHTAKDERGMQAYYIARAGADAIGQHINKESQLMSPSSFNTMLNSMLTDSSPVSFGKGNFKVHITKDAATGNIDVFSTGVVGDATKDITLQLTPIGAPKTPDDAESANVLGWLQGNSHILDKKVNQSVNKPVKFDPLNGQEYIMLTPNGDSTMGATAMFFEHEVTIDNASTVTFPSNLLVFRGKVYLNKEQGGKNQAPAQMILKLNMSDPGGLVDGSTIEGGDPSKKYGRVYFMGGVSHIIDPSKNIYANIPAGAYYFPDNCTMPYGNGRIPWTYDQVGLIPFNMVSGYDMVWK